MSIIQKKIRIIQGYDDNRKKRWLVGLSGVSMLAVIGLWLVYINISVPRVYESEPEKKQVKEEEVERKAGIALTLKRGLKRAYDAAENEMAVLFLGFERAFETARNEIRRSRDYSIEGENVDLRRPDSRN